jgi:hypothetical protein
MILTLTLNRFTVVTNVANDMNIDILSKTQKRSSSCDVVKVTAIVKDILNRLNVKVLSNSKRDTKIYTVSDIVART